ncbi:glycosyltransferase family 2 protein [Puia sp. P3]|uniref:glycosyltransferase family 2 protein n=1 Tax=Puia sp. P3 TaxID=3423952 RepID=UPI003D677922
MVPGGRLLSVVIPYFNMGSYIDECIRSVKNSAYTDMELVIVNDGSTDESSLRKLAVLEKQEKIRVIHQKNRGLALTRNEGARQAAGGYLAFLDADDKVDPTYYEKAIRTLEKMTMSISPAPGYDISRTAISCGRPLRLSPLMHWFTIL